MTSKEVHDERGFLFLGAGWGGGQQPCLCGPFLWVVCIFPNAVLYQKSTMLHKCPPWREALGTDGFEIKKILRKKWEEDSSAYSTGTFTALHNPKPDLPTGPLTTPGWNGKLVWVGVCFKTPRVS